VPTYQYTCTECGHFFEQFQSFSDDALTECPVCAGRLRKVFNAVGVVFKGSGFYRNDSRNGSGTPDKAPDKAPGKTSEKTPQKKSEGAPEKTSASSGKQATPGDGGSGSSSASPAAAR
jgi:putative FmdB family regulatory protein